MNTGSNPSTFIYYIVLYILVIFTSYKRNTATKNRQIIPTQDPKPISVFWKSFLASNEIIYTGSGVFILLLSFYSNFAAGIFAGWILLIVVSLYTILDPPAKERRQLTIHLIIICIIVTATVYVFLIFPAYQFPHNPDGTTKTVLVVKPSIEKKYKVTFPYEDNSLRRIIENQRINKALTSVFSKLNFDNQKFYYQIVITAKKDTDAINAAEKRFMSDPRIEPLAYGNRIGLNKETLLKIDTDNIVAVEINPK